MTSNSEPNTPLAAPLALSIIGAGRVGSVLAYHFQESTIPIAAIIERDEQKHARLFNYFPQKIIHSALTPEIFSKSNLIFVAVHDDQLPEIAEDVAALSIDLSNKIFVHTSGVYSSDVLASLKGRGGLIASAHPIYAFGSDDPTQTSLKGTYFDVEGDKAVLAVLKKLFQQCEINTLEITPAQKIAVHIASVFYSNFFVGLAETARRVLHVSDIPEENYWQPFLPLIESTLKNLSRPHAEDALTGPIKRGDTHTIEKHLDFISRRLPKALPLYLQMSRSILEFTDIPAEAKSKLSELLKRYDG